MGEKKLAQSNNVIVALSDKDNKERELIMSWYNTGEEGAAKAKDEAEQRAKDFSGPQRFWLAPDKSTKFVLLDSAGFFFKEHNYNKGGSWLNWETCLDDIGEEECPFCEGDYRYSFVAAFTIIDLSKYKSKKTGELVSARKKLIIFKSTAQSKILKQKERHENDLKGCVFETTRYTKKECSTGEDFDFIKRATMEEIKELCPSGEDAEEFVKPYNYMEVFKPKSAEELRRILGLAAPVGSEDGPAPQGAVAPQGAATGTSAPAVGGAQAKSLKDLI